MKLQAEGYKHSIFTNVHTQKVAIRQPITLFSIISLLLITAGIWFYSQNSQNIRADKFNELKSIADLKVGQIVQWRLERLGDAQVNSQSPLMRQAVDQWLKNPDDLNLKTSITSILQVIKNEYRYQHLILAGTDSQLLLSSDPSIASLDDNEKQMADQAVKSGEPQFGDFYRSTTADQIFLNISAPILSADNQAIAVLLLQVDPEKYLYPLIQSWPTPSQSAETLLIRKDGEDALFLNSLRHNPAPPLTLRISLANTDVPAIQAISGKVGIYEGHDYRGVEVLSDLAPVPGTSWFMIAKVDKDEILAEVGSLGLTVILFVTLAILMTALLAYFIFYNRQRLLYKNLFQAERERREAQEETKITLYSIGDGVITTNKTGMVTRLNPVAERLTGWAENEAQGKPLAEVFQIINEFTRDEVENPVDRVLREGLVVGLANHTLLIARDNTERPIADSGAPIRDEDENILGVVLVFRDQTKERAAQKELALLSYAINTSLNEITIFDAVSLQFLYVNQGGLKNLGYTLDELLKMTPPDIQPEFTPQSFQKLIQPLLEHQKQVLIFETIHRRANGSIYPVEVHMQLLEYEKERVILAVIQDITDRKHSEEALRKSENLFHSIFEHANDAIHIDNADDQIIQVNQRMCELMGCSREELLRMHVTDLQAPEVRGLSGTVVNKEFNLYGNKPFEALNLDRTGQRIPLEISVSRVESTEGDLYISILRNITERKQTEATLKSQLEELRRWQAVTLGRESRVLELKQEVNELLTRFGQPIRYTSLEEAKQHE